MASPIPFGPISFQAAGTGSVWRSFTNRLRDSISVKDYGAIGDGVTNDTAAIQAALTAAAASGADVYLPPTASGYLITDNISVPAYVGIYSALARMPLNIGYGIAGVNDNRGATILVTGTVNPAFVLGSNSAVRGLRFFYPNQTDTSPPVVYPATLSIALNATDVMVENIAVYNAYDGIDAWRHHARLTIRNCDIWALRHAIQIDDSVDTDRVQQVQIWPYWSQDQTAGKSVAWSCANGIGLRLGHCDGIVVDGVLALWKLWGYSLETTGSGSTYGHFSNCSADTCAEGLHIAGIATQNGLNITNCLFASSVVTMFASSVGIKVMAGAVGSVKVIGCSFWGAGVQNAIFNNGASGSFMQITNCSFYAGLAANGMLKITNKPSVIITNNTFGVISAGGLHLDLNGFTGLVGLIWTNNFFNGGATIFNPGGAPLLVNNNYGIN